METSQSIKSLAKALLAFQVKVEAIKKDSVNPHFRNRYASLTSILEAIKDPLSDCGLVIVQMPTENNGLITTVIHADSGEFIRSTYYMAPERANPQGQGSALTYMRRYCLQAALNLCFEEDDDANAASGQKQAKKESEAPAEPAEKLPQGRWQPRQTDEWLEIGSDMFGKAVEKLKAGTTDINKIRAAIKVSKKTERALLEAAGLNQ